MKDEDIRILINLLDNNLILQEVKDIDGTVYECYTCDEVVGNLMKTLIDRIAYEL